MAINSALLFEAACSASHSQFYSYNMRMSKMKLDWRYQRMDNF